MKGFSWIFISIFPLLFFSCQPQQDTKSQDKTLSFEDLSGRKLDCWKYVMAPIDFGNLAFYKEQFEKVSSSRAAQASDKSIPKTLHFIWLGPKDFPRESIANVHSWIDKHPGWKVKFWSDRKRAVPADNVELIIIDHLHFKDMDDCYYKTDNYAERADVLRYEILFREGGVYVDHDVKCFKPLSDLTDTFEFVCGLELPANTPVASSIHATNCLIAARPFHPILGRCISWLPLVWDEIEKIYPGSDKPSVICRVANRSFAAFADSVRELSGQGTHDMVAPAYYFNAPTDEEAVYARHLYAGTWFQNDNPFEKMARHRLMLISKKVNKILLFTGVAAGINLIVMAVIFYALRKKLRKITGK